MIDQDLKNIGGEMNEDGDGMQNIQNESNKNKKEEKNDKEQKEVKENVKEEETKEEKVEVKEEVKIEEKEELEQEVKEEEKEELKEEVNVEGEEKEDMINKEKKELEEEVKEEETEEVKEEVKEEEVLKDAERGSDTIEENVIDLEGSEDQTGQYRWYAVRIISGHENKVKTYLDNQIKIEGYENKIRNVLIPLEKVFEIKSGKKKVKKKNFLPGYILIEADLDDKIRSFVSQSPSIINMVGSRSVKGIRLDPIPLRSDEIKRINSILSDDKHSEKMDFQLAIGDPVKVTSGPFNNFNGNVFEINTEKMKVKVMVSIFGRKTPIELEFTQVEKQK
jgi:transcriptional antiterminator NusG